MKKMIYAMLIVTGIVAISSCSKLNEETMEQPKVSANSEYTEEFQQLQANITHFNDSVFGSAQVSIHTRGKRLWKWLAVAFSDAVGALVGSTVGIGGAVAGAAGCSLLAANLDTKPLDGGGTAIIFRQRRGTKTAQTDILKDVVFNSKGTNGSICDSIGYFHNVAVFSVYEKQPRMIAAELSATQGYVDSLLLCLDAALPTLTTVEKTELSRQPVVKSLMNNAYSMALESDSPDTFVNKIANAYSSKANEINLIRQFLEDLETSEMLNLDNHNYAQQIINLVNDSSLPQNVKEAIVAGIEVGFASNKLWSSSIIAYE